MIVVPNMILHNSYKSPWLDTLISEILIEKQNDRIDVSFL